MGTEAPVRVLVADDDPMIRRLIELNFGLEGLEVEPATEGEEALRKAYEMTPDLILLDVMMPGIDGWEVCRRLKEDERTAGIPVVFLSARAQKEDRQRGQDLGVSAYVTKPFDPEELTALIRGLVSDART